MKRNAEARMPYSGDEGCEKYRPIRTGEIVKLSDVVVGENRTKSVPESIYGGRRKKGPLPEGVLFDRRQP